MPTLPSEIGFASGSSTARAGFEVGEAITFDPDPRSWTVNSWSVSTEPYDGEKIGYVSCLLKRNNKIMARRVVPIDVVSETIPAFFLVAQGLAMLEPPFRKLPVDLIDLREDHLLDALAEKFGRSLTADEIEEKITKIIEQNRSP